MSESPQLPTTQRALVQDEQGKPKLVDDAPLPELSPGDLLVKTLMVALNPCDYKMGAAFPSPGAVIGNDFVGTVVHVQPDPDHVRGGETRTDIRVGDTVCGLVHGSNPADRSNGAFAEYLRASPDLVLKVPPGFKLEDAASLGSALSTASVALWEGGLGLEISPDNPATEANADQEEEEQQQQQQQQHAVLVYGASTATGTMALQLLRLSGARPLVATCSPRNFALARSYGATSVHDYADPATPARIRAETGGDLELALDVIADAHSVACCHAALSRFGGRMACLELCPGEARAARRTVEVSFPLALEIFGRELQLSKGYERPASAEKRRAAVRRFAMFQRLLDEGKLRAHPVRVMEPGWGSIVEGLKVLKSGSVSGYKIVVPLA